MPSLTRLLIKIISGSRVLVFKYCKLIYVYLILSVSTNKVLVVVVVVVVVGKFHDY